MLTVRHMLLHLSKKDRGNFCGIGRWCLHLDIFSAGSGLIGSICILMEINN